MNRCKSWLGLVFATVCLVVALTPAQGAIILWDEAGGANPLSNVATSPTSLGALNLVETYLITGQATHNSSDILNPQGFDIMSFSLDPLLAITSATLDLTGITPQGSTMQASVVLHTDPPNYANPIASNNSVASGGGSADLLGALGLGAIGPGGAYNLWVGNNGSDFSTVDYQLTLVVTPEPTTLLLLYAGAIGLLLQRPFRHA